ncbi:hypothetical protein MC885_003735 [Smutsia gigantea]|nr:hypothetical protein MC885_003735 [Smutsia gigantea]
MTFYLLHCRTGPGLWLGRDRLIICAKFSRGPWLGDIKGSCVRGQHSLSEPQQVTPVGNCEHRALEMRTVFLTIGLSLIAALQAQEPLALGEKASDVSGKWYLKAMTSDQDIPGTKPDAVTPMTLTVLEGGDLEAVITMLIDGQCQEAKLVLEKTSEYGKYLAYGGKRMVYIRPSRAEGHCILYCEGELQGKQVRMAKLVGRDPENNQEALQDFKEVAKARGLALEIFIPHQSETCPP